MAEAMTDPGAAQGIQRMIRCRQTKRYFKNGDWTDDPIQASTFDDQMDVVRTCLDHGLKNIDLVLRAHGGEAEFFCTQIR